MSWEPLDLRFLEERPALEPTLGGLGLVYPGKRHVFSGPPESLKTIGAYAIALAVIRQGGSVVLIDLEMGPHDARDRFRDLGASDADLERLDYIEPDSPATEEIIGGLIALAPSLVVIDASAGAFDLQGLDANSREDVERFAGIYVRAFWLHGIATILIDHVVKNADNRGKFAIGSERKIGSADVHLGFETIRPIARGGSGLYRLMTHKDRFGHLSRPRAAELELRSDPETGAIAWAFTKPQEAQEEFRPTILMERVSRYLESQEEPVSRNAIEEAVTGKRDALRLAINCLVGDEYASENPGPRGGRLIASVCPFREDDLAPTSPPNEGADLAPTSPRAESLNEAEETTSPHLAPTSPLAPETTSPQIALSPTGERDWRGEVGNVSEEDVERLAERMREAAP
ncbi:MAG: AAA family ATPase [Actinomycetota bacterium]